MYGDGRGLFAFFSAYYYYSRTVYYVCVQRAAAQRSAAARAAVGAQAAACTCGDAATRRPHTSRTSTYIHTTGPRLEASPLRHRPMIPSQLLPAMYHIFSAIYFLYTIS